MILKAKERGDAPQLARYLLSLRDNEHVELHEVSGFVSDDLSEAFQEADAIARGTRCKNHLFSISLNPPQGAYVEPEVFERTADHIEKKLGLENQPRAIVFHEKDGRRHAHVVWSRIDTERMRAINLSHYKSKLRDISRELFLENDWDMPRGLQDHVPYVIHSTSRSRNGSKQSVLGLVYESSNLSFSNVGRHLTIGARSSKHSRNAASGSRGVIGVDTSPSTITARSIRFLAMPV